MRGENPSERGKWFNIAQLTYTHGRRENYNYLITNYYDFKINDIEKRFLGALVIARS